MALRDELTARHDDDGWALPVLMLLTVVALFIWLIVLLATGSSAPSVENVERATAAVASQYDSAVTTTATATCTYDGSSWTPGQVFHCSIWEDHPSSNRDVSVRLDTVSVTVQSAPPSSSGHFASLHFRATHGAFLVNVDSQNSPVFGLTSSHYALARA